MKYAIHAGWVQSKHDGDWHWISAHRLADLYGLRRGDWFAWTIRSSRGRNSKDYVNLRPRFDGDYRIR